MSSAPPSYTKAFHIWSIYAGAIGNVWVIVFPISPPVVPIDLVFTNKLFIDTLYFAKEREV
jgi:hypothetical protein